MVVVERKATAIVAGKGEAKARFPRALWSRDFINEGARMSLVRILELHFAPNECPLPWIGLGDVSEGEFRDLSIVERAALMMTDHCLRNQALTILNTAKLDSFPNPLARIMQTFSYNLAGELILNGRLGRERDNKGRFIRDDQCEHLTARQCSLLRQLIGITEHGYPIAPKRVIDITKSSMHDASRVIAKQVNPLVKKINRNWGGDFHRYVLDIAKEWMGIDKK